MKSLVIALFFPLCCLAQQTKSLQPGDTLPAHLLTSLTGNLQPETSNHLILLDFFASWCAPCVRKFSTLDSIQDRFQDKVTIILVSSIGTTDNEERLNKFFARYKKSNGTSWQFHIIINDTILVKLFPHRIVPHYVWLYDNKVIAITSSASVTVQNITALLDHQPFSLPVKNDELESKNKL